MTIKWFSRDFREGDEDNLRKLHKLVFDTQISIERWKWRYKENPAGQSIIVVAESNQRIVGQYALVPLIMRIENTLCVGSQSLDTMVHPDYRGQGIFVSLAEKAYKVAEEKGIRFIYGFPNGNSHYGITTKLGWRDIYDGIPLWIKPINLESLIKKRFLHNYLIAKMGSSASKLILWLLNNKYSRIQENTAVCVIREISSFDNRFDAHYQAASKEYSIMVVRDERYLNWRYLRKPGERYTTFVAERGERLLGYIVLKCAEKFDLQIGFIVDILVIPQESQAARQLISAATEYFTMKKMDIVGCLMLPSTFYSQKLKQMGFIMTPKKLLPQEMYLGVRSFSNQYTREFLTIPRNWFITWGDHDVI